MVFLHLAMKWNEEDKISVFFKPKHSQCDQRDADQTLTVSLCSGSVALPRYPDLTGLGREPKQQAAALGAVAAAPDTVTQLFSLASNLFRPLRPHHYSDKHICVEVFPSTLPVANQFQ